MTRPSDQPQARSSEQPAPQPAEQPVPQPATRPAEQLRADARQNRARLITAATEAFAARSADAPMEDIARRAGVGIGTLYRHFPSRLDLQAAVFRTQVRDICNQ